MPARSNVGVALFVLALAATSSSAFAQRALPTDLKTAADVKPRVGQIQAFITAQVTALANEKNPQGQQTARDALARECGGSGAAAASASFIDAYTSALNDAIKPLAKSPSVRTRMLAAITLYKVAANTRSGRLGDAISPFVLDESVAVALWGMRAAAPTIAPLANAGTPTKLPAAVVEGVKKHPTNGDLVDEAYKALTLGNKVSPASAAIVAPEVLRLFQYRVSLYVTSTPPRTDTDRAAVNFLSLEALWATPTGKQMQPQIMQELVNFAGLAAQHTGPREPNDRAQFIDKLKGVGAAFQQIGAPNRLADPSIVAAGQKLYTLRANASQENEFTDAATAAFQAVKTKFPNVKPFPTMDPGATAEPKEAEIIEMVGGEDVGHGGPPATQPGAATRTTAPPGAVPKTPAPAPKSGGTPPPVRAATPKPPAPAATPRPAGAK
jgi:hypothetical protein